MEYTINRALLKKYMDGFKAVLIENGEPFSLTAANGVYKNQEMYKYQIAQEAEVLLHRSEWSEEDIGTGKIFRHVKDVLDISDNLVYPTNRLKFYDVCEADLEKSERVFYQIFRGNDDEAAFNLFTSTFRKIYSIVGYLFFVHDYKRYLPIASFNFDERFEKIGIDYRMSHRCSWENYKGFIHIVRDIRDEMQNYFEIDGINLLDAHSFLWMFWKIDKYYETVSEEPYIVHIEGSDTVVTTTARIGQSQYRKNLLALWDNKCSVTGCTEVGLLTASHIKPWRDSNPEEKGDVYNGLLLTPNLDAAFDEGYISFDDSGRILVSDRLTEDNCKNLGIDREMKMRRISEAHRRYLAYHREKVFINNNQ